MPQMVLPMSGEGSTLITDTLSFQKKDGRITYFHGMLPVFVHDEDDIKTFRMITSQFCVNGQAKQADIVRAFGVTSISVKRSVKTYRTSGPKGFYAPRVGRGPAVLTEPVLAAAQEQLNNAVDPKIVAEKLGLKKNTLEKAIRAGRLHMLAVKKKSRTRHKSK
jgi:hypothetical protein